ncbi:putative LysM domain protein [Microdochium trichocladiopsis]|uniref:LysM domain protein n=1 Tax=Microdochium trichocladiopsis TaxID=1682393 RepID=A0A9P8XTR1_9PEZI|nr:putative LysM domain protein [Microdochium trichocladiopsis]KAH7017948.1 putative LysM domain protein [Microdochium trichocladiopsis]
MRHSLLYLAAAALPVSQAGLVASRQAYEVDPNTSKYCSWYHDMSTGETCDFILTSFAISLEAFLRWNPSVNAGCTNLLQQHSYCVEAADEPAPPTPSKPPGATVTTPPSTTTQPPAPTTTGNGVATPLPTMPGMTNNCRRFYLTQKGDTCAAIVAAAGINGPIFYAWNPAVNSDCTGLWSDTWVCIGDTVGPSITLQPPASTTTTSAGNGVVTPQPVQSGITSNCRRFYFVQSGDTCDAIIKAAGIYGPKFHIWNPAVQENCSGLWSKYYVCIGNTIGPSITINPPAATTTTSAGNGVATPQPVQSGMTTNCRRFYLVRNGDTCNAIIAAAGIYGPNFYIWNPAIGSACTNLWSSYYVCIGNTVGPSITINPPQPTTTRPAGNGVATPTPIQTGMVTNCKLFYQVRSGDTCATIAASKGITVANFVKWNPAVGSGCTGMWANTWACVGLI